MTEQTEQIEICGQCKVVLILNVTWYPGDKREGKKYCIECSKRYQKTRRGGFKLGQKKDREKMEDKIRKESNPKVKKILKNFYEDFYKWNKIIKRL